MKPKVIAIVGPTASGKSSLGAYLAKKLKGEILSADSRQIYKGMNIISRAEPAHLVSIADPRRQYSAGSFAKAGQRVISMLLKRQKTPIIVGGTGFYAEALLMTPLPAVAPNKKLRRALSKKSLPGLLSILKKLDPKSARRVDPHNKVRLVRAIEIARALGTVPALQTAPNYPTLWLGLPPPRNYEQALRKGVQERLRRGVLAEAKRLRRRISHRRFLSLGFEFKLLADHLDKKLSKQAFIEALVRGERKYAKRQSRWFKRNSDIHWVKNKTEALRLAKKFLSR